ncbi:MAG: NADH-quinone oxidoreductase subunit C [Dehalococcoidales bacterium]|nr:NADH-quinone oxidoreductase subunit C [Dehalococcoidales bacterium]MDD5498870.1 NADH-quinone oxidoreductase subunit C [Dehalococcoidales bacterium]
MMDIVTTGLMTHLESKQIGSHFSKGKGGEYYLRVPDNGIVEAAGWLADRKDLALIGIWAVPSHAKDCLELYYAFELKHPSPALVMIAEVKNNQAPSVSKIFPAAINFERRTKDWYGLGFTGLPDTRRLLLHEAYPPDYHPMVDSNPEPLSSNLATTEYSFKEFGGEGLYQVPVGPVHAGIIEPGHFRFSVIGETIFNLELRLGYKHRGLNKLAAGKTIAEVNRLSESISGDESAVNACTFSLAVENIAGIDPPKRAWELRTVLLEMERLYSHLGDLAGMLVDVGYPIGASPFFILREEIMRWNAIFTGSRFLRGAIIPGGLSRDIEDGMLQQFKCFLNTFSRRVRRALSSVDESAWVIDRFETTGIVSPELVAPLSLSGPIARASGYDSDTRQLHTYGIYTGLKYMVPVKTSGDVLARFNVKAEEAISSIGIINETIARCAPGPIFSGFDLKSGQALAILEAPRGRNIHWLRVKNGTVEHWEVITASFCNWLAIEHAVINNILPDFPVINKSFNLSYAGNDL